MNLYRLFETLVAVDGPAFGSAIAPPFLEILTVGDSPDPASVVPSDDRYIGITTTRLVDCGMLICRSFLLQ